MPGTWDRNGGAQGTSSRGICDAMTSQKVSIDPLPPQSFDPQINASAFNTGLDGLKVVPFKTAHLREKEVVNRHTKVKTGTFNCAAQGLPATVSPAGTSGHGMDQKTVAGRDHLLQEMRHASESTEQSPQFLSSLMVWPYLFPAYGLLRLATSLEVEVKLPEWYQLIRAAVVVTAKVEDLRHAREGQRPSPEYNPQKYPSRQEPWVMLWLRLQPTQRRRPVSPQQLMMPEDCLHYPNNTSAADWREFWPKTRETVFMVMLELKACSPCNDQSQVIAETMDPRRWSSWVVDVLWVFRQLLRILPLEEDAIMTCVKRAQNIREPETSAAALTSQTGERLGRLTAGPSSASVQTDSQLPASTRTLHDDSVHRPAAPQVSEDELHHINQRYQYSGIPDGVPNVIQNSY
ncbi:hypothetical protein LXA43DRAFT_1064046 [Ganoderma leucocontextum]|nr:hypothetical protein LXA43DRAFT_1064046 [Ganoderma leucocontextum]